MEITIPRGKQRSEELKNFNEEMVKAIKEAEIALKIKEENKKNKDKEDSVNSELNRARTDAFGYIEKSMTERGLKSQDLGQYSNYKEQINSINEVYKIRDLREEILSAISKLGIRNPERRQRDDYYPPRDPREKPDPRFPEKPDFPKPERIPDERDKPRDRKEIEEDKVDDILGGFRDSKYDNWTHQDLVEEIKKEQLNNASLQKLITLLEIRNKELEEDIRELRAVTPQTSRIKQMIFGKEKQLSQYKMALTSVASVSNNNNNNNTLPIIPIISVVSIVSLLGLIIYKVKKNKIKR